MTREEAKARLEKIRDMVDALAQEAAVALAQAYPSGTMTELIVNGHVGSYEILQVREPWLGAPREFDIAVRNPRTRQVTRRTVQRIVELASPGAPEAA